jgi:hypothetical protein
MMLQALYCAALFLGQKETLAIAQLGAEPAGKGKWKEVLFSHLRIEHCELIIEYLLLQYFEISK